MWTRCGPSFLLTGLLRQHSSDQGLNPSEPFFGRSPVELQFGYKSSSSGRFEFRKSGSDQARCLDAVVAHFLVKGESSYRSDLEQAPHVHNVFAGRTLSPRIGLEHEGISLVG